MAPLQYAAGNDRIYVQIPAYRDAELPATLLDLYAKAGAPNNLRVRVFWQRGVQENLPISVFKLPCLELVAIPFEESRGCNWARNLLQNQWQGESYTLLLDSHHRFVKGWDRTLVEMYEGLRSEGVNKPLITGYLPAYSPDRDPSGRKRRPYKIYPFQREHGLLTRLISYPIPGYRTLRNPVPADFASLHFLFTSGAFNQEVAFDPSIYFFGDEVVTSLRAYTHGYDLYHPHVVMGWHCFDRTSRVPHWADHGDWHEQHKRSLRIMQDMYRGTYRGRFGTGKCRTVQDYEDHIMLKLTEVSRSGVALGS
jgi:hypothetical protein